MRQIHVCYTTAGLDEIPKKHHKDISKVLTVLHAAGRFSVFEATETRAMARTMDRVMKEGFVEDIGGGYPWTNVKLTQKGLDAMEGRFWHGPEEDPFKDFVKIGSTYVQKSIVERMTA